MAVIHLGTGRIAVQILYHRYAGYILCTNVDKSGTNHEYWIVYTQVIRIQCMPDLIRDLRFVNSQPLVGFARIIKGHELDLHWFVCDAFISIHCSCILEDLFWKFLNSSRLINYQLTGLWLVVIVRRWVRNSWIWRIHEAVHGDSQFVVYLRKWCTNFTFVRITHSV